MEIDGEDGSRIEIRAGSELVIGRGSGLCTADCTVSRHHVLLKVDDHPRTGTSPVRVHFEVLGKNPVWVRSGGGGKVRVFRRFQKGEVAEGDGLCFSGKQPVWFAVKGVDRRRELDLEAVSEAEAENPCPTERDVDPVKEFGFLVIGHEFDQYPKQKLRNVKDWNWFLEESNKVSSDDEDELEKKKLKRRKRKKGKGVEGQNEDEDEDWTAESEEEKENLTRPMKFQKQKYFTRSKDHSMLPKRNKNDAAAGFAQKKRTSGSRHEEDVEDEEEDEEDETLGGFIVTDEKDAEQEEESEADEEEEEEFIEDEEED